MDVAATLKVSWPVRAGQFVTTTATVFDRDALLVWS